MIFLGEPHIKTLTKLYEMAKKHDCVIAMSIEPISDSDVDFDIIVDKGDMNEEIKEDIQENLELKDCNTSGYKYTFELIDKRDSQHYKYNTLTYFDISTSFKYAEFLYRTLNEETQEWLDDNDNYDDNYIFYHSEDQRMQGWEGIDTSFVNVYREGMLLKFFGDLVCEYLGEEKIQEVY